MNDDDDDDDDVREEEKGKKEPRETERGKKFRTPDNLHVCTHVNRLVHAYSDVLLNNEEPAHSFLVRRGARREKEGNQTLVYVYTRFCGLRFDHRIVPSLLAFEHNKSDEEEESYGDERLTMICVSNQ